MQDDARRFLALNCVLNGHNLMEAFDNDAELGARCLNMKLPKDVEALARRLHMLEDNKKNFNPLVATLLNFYRTNQYAFVATDGAECLTLQGLRLLDRRGSVNINTVYSVLNDIILDWCKCEDESQIRIEDGILYIPASFKKEQVYQGYANAYELYKNGPFNGDGLVLEHEEYTSLDEFRPMSPAGCRSILNDFVKRKAAPTLFGKTVLSIPDVMRVYKYCGCIFAPSSYDDTVNWLIPMQSRPASKSVNIDIDTLRTLTVAAPTQLGQYIYLGGGRSTPKIALKEGA